MNNPSFENIDQWFFEYTEGNLTPLQEDRFVDFIASNPGLEDELKIWESTRLSKPSISKIAPDDFLKPIPLFFRPISLILTSLIILFFAWIGFLYYPENITYSQSTIDTVIIPVGNNSNIIPAFVIDKTTSTPITNKRITTEKYFSNHSNTKRESSNWEPTTHLITSNQNKKQNNTKPTQIEGFSNAAANHFEKHTNIFLKKTDRRENISNLPIRDAEYIATIVPKLAHTSLKKINVRPPKNNKIGKTFRKIERIMNRPVALRSTNRPHYVVPGITAFKAIPALAGEGVANRLLLTSRYQWANQTNAQLINTISWDGYIKGLHGALGVDINYDAYNLNKISNYTIGVTYSPKFKLGDNFSLSPAVRFKMGVMNLNHPESLLGSSIEIHRNNTVTLFTNNQTPNGKKLWYKDVGLSLSFNSKWFYLGLNLDNLGRHYNNYYSNDLSKDYRSDVHYSAILGAEYRPINYNYKIEGYLFYQNYGALNELWVGTNFQYRWFQVGAGLNTNLDFGGTLGLIFNKFEIHYNLDYTKSQLLQNKFLSHQISLRVLLSSNRPNHHLFDF